MEISCKLSSEGTLYIKFQNLFLGKIRKKKKKKNQNMSSDNVLQRILSVKKYLPSYVKTPSITRNKHRLAIKTPMFFFLGYRLQNIRPCEKQSSWKIFAQTK